MFMRTGLNHAMSALDRPVWAALTTRHQHLAQIHGSARRLPPDIGAFAATPDDSRESIEDLAGLIRQRGQPIVLMQSTEPATPDGVKRSFASAGVQMVANYPIIAQPAAAGAIRLGAVDVPDMVALTQLTEPGPFEPRTHLLGTYWGVREHGRLIAMAGERLRQPGFIEVSAVCVHPDHRGCGHATRLTALVAATTQASGRTPFLHAYADNGPAIRIYERLGFRIRREMRITRLEPAIADAQTAAK
ncbi:MAG: GNAT family N-acetyltransferase [Pseudomonadota bacterium]